MKATPSPAAASSIRKSTWLLRAAMSGSKPRRRQAAAIRRLMAKPSAKSRNGLSRSATRSVELAANLLPDTEDLEWQDVRREPLVAVVAADHPLARASSTDIAALKDDPFILFAEGFAINRLIASACRRRGFEPVIAARSSQVDFLMELAAAGVGVAFMPRMLAEHGPGARIRALLLTEPETEWRLTMVWRQGGYLSHAARAWLEMARQPSG